VSVVPWDGRSLLIGALGRSQGGSVNKLWWFIRNQIAKTISTSNKFTTCRSWRGAILPAGCE
jgi:hypothetical protein